MPEHAAAKSRANFSVCLNPSDYILITERSNSPINL